MRVKGPKKPATLTTTLFPLPVYFVDLNSEEKRNGLCHSAAVFKAHSTAYLQVNAPDQLPLDEWVKGKMYGICEELGYLAKDFPENKDKGHFFQTC